MAERPHPLVNEATDTLTSLRIWGRAEPNRTGANPLPTPDAA